MGDDGRQHQEFRARRVDGTTPDGNLEAAKILFKFFL